MWTELMTRLKQILVDNDNIQEVFDYFPDKFDGDPTAIITPSENENDFYTTDQNIRNYAFKVMLFVTRTAKTKNQSDTDMRVLVDSVLDDFDKNWNLSTVVNPTGYCFVNLFAVPSGWGYAGQDDEYRLAEIVVRARVVVNVSEIS